MTFHSPIDALDALGSLAAVSATLRWRRAAEVEDLRLAQHWADLHAEDPNAARKAKGLHIRVFEDRLVAVGGVGSPWVQESALAELAVAREVHPLAAHRLVGDALDLRHRLPRIWHSVQSLDAEVWLARKVVSLARALSPEGAALVDAAVAAAIGGESPARVLDIARAKIIEADPATHQAKVEAEKRRRYAALGRVDQHGLPLVIARVTAGDAAWIDAILERVAEILARRCDSLEKSRDEFRSEAMGWLARPAELLRLLLEADASAVEVDDDAEKTVPCRAFAFPADLLDALRCVDPVRLRPRATLYVHLHESAVDGSREPGHGVARVEGLGPHGVDQVTDLLRHTHVTVKPVIDLRDRISVNAYEHPSSLADRVHLTRIGDYFPYATSTTRAADLDHPTPYDTTGPPGQTGVHNSGPLVRRHHRLKTHAGFTARQTAPGCYVWRTRLGQHVLVDHRGTLPLAPDIGEQLLHGQGLEVQLTGAFLRR